jgi:anti-anti-sigma factor
MKLSLVSIEKAGYVRIAAEGEITTTDFLDAGGKNPFEAVLGTAWSSHNLLLSLEKVTFIDSQAIGWLIDSQRKTQAAGGRLVVYAAPPRVRDLFALLKLGKVLNLKSDLQSAQDFVTASTEAK